MSYPSIDMENPQFPPYDNFEKPITKLPATNEERKCLHNMTYYLQLLLSNIGICGLLVGYTFLGTFIFLWIERRTEVRLPPMGNGTTAIKSNEDISYKTVENIWEITVSLNILYRENWTRLAGQEISKLQEEMISKLTEDFWKIRNNEKLPFEWTYARAFLYSLTVITTIGKFFIL